MLRPGLPPVPPRMEYLPHDHRGFPVPWFVAWIDGVPDFRVIGPGRVQKAIRENRCWLCGHPRGVHSTFVIGPMCAVNRVSSEPPCHLECAEFAAKACPFLANPRMRRNEKDLPEETSEPAGQMIKRNPGVTLLWTTKSFRVVNVENGQLIQVGDPDSVQWFKEARAATRGEVIVSIDSGLPALREMAEREGPEAMRELDHAVAAIQSLLPS